MVHNGAFIVLVGLVVVGVLAYLLVKPRDGDEYPRCKMRPAGCRRWGRGGGGSHEARA